jgi:hypothetical protein
LTTPSMMVCQRRWDERRRLYWRPEATAPTTALRITTDRSISTTPRDTTRCRVHARAARRSPSQDLAFDSCRIPTPVLLCTISGEIRMIRDSEPGKPPTTGPQTALDPACSESVRRIRACRPIFGKFGHSSRTADGRIADPPTRRRGRRGCLRRRAETFPTLGVSTSVGTELWRILCV